MRNSGKIILGLLGAAAAGVAIGMLLAPEKGSEIRRRIGEKAGDLASRISDLVSYGKDKLDEMDTAVTEQADGLMKDATRQGEKMKESVS